MPVRRRSASRKAREHARPPGVETRPAAAPARDEAGEAAPQATPLVAKCSHDFQESKPALPLAVNRDAGRDGSLPLAVVLEILAGEYQDSVQGEALCRAAVRLAAESGVLDRYRARWDDEETDLSGRRSVLLFDRRQCLELIEYHRNKGNQAALQREKDKLLKLEGRLLLGAASPVQITDDDLEELERYIKECGF